MEKMDHRQKRSGVHTSHSSSTTADIRQVQNVAFADATAKANVKPWTKAMFKLYLCLFIATLNSCINGYDGSLMGAINSYHQYRSYFGFNIDEGTPTTGIVYAIYTIGNLVGSFVAGPATDFKGRKWGMFIGTSIIIFGACIQATCTNLGGFMGGRFVLGFGVAITSTAGPAWLIANDRHEEALDTMAKFHGEGNRDSPIVKLEYKEMVEDISVTGSDKRWWDYRELFNSREARYRTMLVVAMAFFGQWSGNGPVSYYYPTMLQGAGITSNHTRLLFNGMQNVVSFSGAIFGAVYTDSWGRRPQLLVSTGLLVGVFAIVCALVATNLKTGEDGKPIYLDDGRTPDIKRPGQARAYYFLFIFWDMFEFTIIYFFFVETRRRTLEEISEIFNAKKPVQHSLNKTRIIMHGNGRGVTEMLDKEDVVVVERDSGFGKRER
ncbi:FucP, Fucose permease [Pyrenophora tritici-repentis]|uniref:FucP, Fucose permease n=1 Tax=Pyrenophora tritici-repentis TaxID=45151 RepID=A0A316ZRJ6_9PLEO|nr:FucP, Fucose permease [Pyrenophora tritici-repentis]KAI1573171.1 FucP Fucose permease [Pyrenophora tritici-repentis]